MILKDLDRNNTTRTRRLTLERASLYKFAPPPIILPPMRIVPISFIVLLAVVASVRSQNALTVTEGVVSTAVPTAGASTANWLAAAPSLSQIPRPAQRIPARIIGGVPDGTSSPVPSPKPGFIAPGRNIVDTKVHQQGGRTITVQKIKPIALPPPEAPSAPQPETLRTATATADFKQHLADYLAAHPPVEEISISATVYRRSPLPPRTLVRYWTKSGGDPITFWSSADFSLISGIRSIAATDGRTYSLSVTSGNINIRRLTALSGGKFQPPDIPDFAVGPATFILAGKPPADPAILVPIQSLHDIYNKEYWRLKFAFEGCERARLQREADLKANPPQPQNIVLNFWTTDTPASTEKGGAK